jgi:hypothetical protein
MLAAAVLLILQGCPDPTTAAELGNPGPGGANPGAEGGPAPAGSAANQGPPPSPGSFDVPEGAGVVVSGTLTYQGAQTGEVRIDFLHREGDAPPQLLHVEILESVGSFSISAPPNLGETVMVAFIDVDQDGPSATDPAGLQSIVIEESEILNLEIQLSDEPDLGNFTPGNNAPPDALPAIDGAAPTNPEIVPADSNAADVEVENTAPESNDGTETTPPDTSIEPVAGTEAAPSE